jgi:hypothetical protein
MKPRMFARQDFDVNCFVFHDSFAVLKIHNVKGATIENSGSAPIWKNDFGFNVNGFSAVGHKMKAMIGVFKRVYPSCPVDVVVSLADRRYPGCERRLSRAASTACPKFTTHLFVPASLLVIHFLCFSRPGSCSCNLRGWFTAKESHQPFQVLRRGRQIELFAYEAHPKIWQRIPTKIQPK